MDKRSWKGATNKIILKFCTKMVSKRSRLPNLIIIFQSELKKKRGKLKEEDIANSCKNKL